MVAVIEKEKVLSSSIIPSGWIAATWEDFLEISQAKDCDKAKFYYYQGSYYSEMGVGANHAFVNTIVIILISLYCMKRNILAKGYTNCSYRKIGMRECQLSTSGCPFQISAVSAEIIFLFIEV